jgi:hypothetical protein
MMSDIVESKNDRIARLEILNETRATLIENLQKLNNNLESTIAIKDDIIELQEKFIDKIGGILHD